MTALCCEDEPRSAPSLRFGSLRHRPLPSPTTPPVGNVSGRSLASAFVSISVPGTQNQSECTAGERKPNNNLQHHPTCPTTRASRYLQSFNVPASTIRTQRRVRGVSSPTRQRQKAQIDSVFHQPGTVYPQPISFVTRPHPSECPPGVSIDSNVSCDGSSQRPFRLVRAGITENLILRVRLLSCSTLFPIRLGLCETCHLTNLPTSCLPFPGRLATAFSSSRR